MAVRDLRILVVEDEPDILAVYTTLLRADAADVVGVSTGREALDACRQGAFDAVLTDLDLPDIPGDVLIGAILSHCAHATVVVVTGEAEPAPTRARAAGARVVFTKPVEWSAVVAALGDLAGSAAA
jgi:CheY-like chemotaxis protein